MKEIYLDIMEWSLAAYDEARIRRYVDQVRAEGLTEHGFPRLGANMGILMAHGRCMHMKDVFVQIMDLCCAQIPHLPETAPSRAGNDFSVREICWCLEEVEGAKLFPESVLDGWKKSLYDLDPWRDYCVVAPSPDTAVGNWAAFAAVSEYVRGQYLGLNTTRFVDWQIASQLLSLDENGMYKDPNQPMVYDYMTRILLASFYHLGYDGKHSKALWDMMEKSAQLSLQMQSVTGEMPYGGRSNQCLHNEPVMAAYFEMEAARHKQKGEYRQAGKFKAAALASAQCAAEYLRIVPVSHMKNRYDPDSMIGCESYAYFDKYMITVASNAYIAYRMADDSIEASGEEGCYAVETSPDFHKVFASAGGYHLQWDTQADFHYDACGLGRVHKKGCPSPLCLSVPFPVRPNYKLEKENPRPMALGSENSAAFPYVLREKNVQDGTVHLFFDCAGGGEGYEISEQGVNITFERPGFCLPVFEFDGERETQIQVQPGMIQVEYCGSRCMYCFDGQLLGYENYYNRNGRYRVYRVLGKSLSIVMIPKAK